MSIIIKSELTSSMDVVDVGKANIFFDGSDNNIKYKKSDGTINFFAAASASNVGSGVTVFSGANVNTTTTFIFRSLQAGNGISIFETGNTIFVSSTISESFVNVSNSFVAVSNSFVNLNNNFINISGGYVNLSNSFVALSTSFINVSSGYINLSNSFSGLSNSFINVSGGYVALSNSFASFSSSYSRFNVSGSTATTFLVNAASAGKYIRLSNSAGINVIVSASIGLTIGDFFNFFQVSSGQLTFVTSGTVINSAESLKTRTTGSSVTLIYVATNAFDLIGDLEII